MDDKKPLQLELVYGRCVLHKGRNICTNIGEVNATYMIFSSAKHCEGLLGCVGYGEASKWIPGPAAGATRQECAGTAVGARFDCQEVTCTRHARSISTDSGEESRFQSAWSSRSSRESCSQGQCITHETHLGIRVSASSSPETSAELEPNRVIRRNLLSIIKS
jgi:hypothetical protein